MPKKKRAPKALYQLKITLADSKPPIWRRLIVKDNTRLDHLHSILQITMGWYNYHLHQYKVGRSYIGIPDPEFEFDLGMSTKNELDFCLHDIVKNPKDKFTYEYDFGDGWEHKIVLEDVLPLDFSDSPLVIKGKKACPPEDCGGIWGYYNFLDAINDPNHEEHDDMIAWLAEKFDPDKFDIDAINKELKKLEL